MQFQRTCPNGHDYQVQEGDDGGTCPVCESTLNQSLMPTSTWDVGKAPKHVDDAAQQIVSGQQLGRFRLLSILGQGGFGVVYRAYDPQLDREVALKSPRQGVLAGQQEVARFLREARAAAQLRHPNIAPVYDAGEVDQRYYIACGLIKGNNLRRYRREVGELGDRVIANLIMQVAEALHYAHSQGVVHRDIKPDNIMIDQAGQPHVMDFGLARRDEGEVLLTREGVLMGTPAYMSPEQASGRSHVADARTDIWSLGVVFYELLCGQLPFSGETVSLLQAIVKDEPTEPRKLRAAVPKDLETICLKCIAKDPDSRYFSGQDVADEIGRWLRNEPIQARPISVIERSWRVVCRYPVVASLTVLLFFTLATGICVSLYYALVADRRADELLNKQNLLVAKRIEAEDSAEQAQRQELIANRRAYSRSVAASVHAWEEGRSQRALHLLASVQPKPGQIDLRGFEWRFLWGRVHQQVATLVGHRGTVNSGEFFADGQRFVTGGQDGTVRIWNAAAGRELRRIDAHYGEVNDVVVTPDQRQIISCGSDGLIKFWDVETGEMQNTLRGHRGTVASLAVSPTGQLLASGSYQTNSLGELLLWDLQSGSQVRELKGHRQGVQRHPWGIAALAFSPDEKQLASASYDGRLYLFAVATGEMQADLKGHTGWTRSVAYTPDGKVVATGSDDGTVRFWNAETGIFIEALSPGVGVTTALDFSADGKTLTIGATHGALNYDMDSQSFKGLGHVGEVAAVTYSSGQELLATCGRDELVRLWDVAALQSDAVELPTPQWARAAVFSPDGDWFAVGSNDNAVTIRDAETHQEIIRLEVQRGSSCRTIAVSPLGQLLAVGDSRGRATVWKVADWSKLWDAKSHPDGIAAIRFTADGSKLVTAGTDGVIRFSDPDNGDELFRLDAATQTINALALAPKGDQLAVAYGGRGDATLNNEIKVWDWRQRKPLASLQGHLASVQTLAFSPDAKHLASGDYDGAIRVWDAETFAPLGLLRGHSDVVHGITFSPDSATIASCSSDTTVKLWGTASGDELATLTAGGSRGHYVSRPTDVCFAPDARQLVACCGDLLNFGKPGALLIWTAMPLAQADQQLRDYRRRLLREQSWAAYTGIRDLALRYDRQANDAGAIDARMEAIDPLETLRREFPEELRYLDEHSSLHNNLGLSLSKVDRLPEALREHEIAIQGYTAVHQSSPGPQALADLGGAIHNRGNVLRRTGQIDDARDHYSRAIKQQQEALRLQPDHVVARKFLANHYMMLAVLDADADQLANAETNYRKAVGIHDQLTKDLPAVGELIDSSVRMRLELADLLSHMERPQESRELVQQALHDQLDAVRNQPLAAHLKRTLRRAYLRQAELLSADNDIDGLHALAETIQQERSDQYQAAFDAATILSHCLALMKEQEAKNEPSEEFTSLAQSIVELLRPGITRGSIPVSLIDRSPELEPLRASPQLEKLLARFRK